MQLVTLGRGTVNDAMLDSFGLESHEKAVLFSFVTREKWRELQKGMHKKLQIDLPGTGVAFLLPVGSIGGRGVYTFLTRKFEMEGEEEMADTEYEMIIAVANQGYIEPIMEAARSAGAGGGTVIHAKGTGMNEMGKFFGHVACGRKRDDDDRDKKRAEKRHHARDHGAGRDGIKGEDVSVFAAGQRCSRGERVKQMILPAQD